MKGKKITALILSIAMTAAFCVPVRAVTEEDISRARKSAQEAEKELTETEEKITNLENDKKELETYLDELNAQLRKLNQELDVLDEKIGAKQVELEITSGALERAKLDEEKQYHDMKARIRFMYEKGNTDLIVTLLSSGSITELLNRADQFEKITGYDRNKLKEYQETKEAVEVQEKTLEQEQTELLNLKESSEKKQAEIEALVEENGVKIKEYEEKIGEEELNASDLKKRVEDQKNALNALIERARQEKREAEEKARREAELKRLAEEKAAKEAAEKKAAEEKAAGQKTSSKEEGSSNKKQEDKNTTEKSSSSEEQHPEETEKKSESESREEKAPDPEPEEEKESEPAEPEKEEEEEEEEEAPQKSSGETFLGTFKITAYCNCAKCCGRAGQATASGVMPRSSHTVAMGGVPFGTKLRVGGTVYTVEDRGTPYGHVDIFFDSHSEALQFGLRYMDVYQLN